jgi:hypothetical protein
MAVPKKGRLGINGLIARKGPGVWGYTVHSPKEGSVRVQVAVVGKYLSERWGKHSRKRYAFVVHHFPFALSALWKKYRTRFGIESSHRVWEQAQARGVAAGGTVAWAGDRGAAPQPVGVAQVDGGQLAATGARRTGGLGEGIALQTVASLEPRRLRPGWGQWRRCSCP